MLVNLHGVKVEDQADRLSQVLSKEAYEYWSTQGTNFLIENTQKGATATVPMVLAFLIEEIVKLRKEINELRTRKSERHPPKSSIATPGKGVAHRKGTPKGSPRPKR